MQQQKPKSDDGSMVVGEECGGRLTQPIPGSSRGAVPHHRRKSLMVEAWLHAGRVIFLRKRWQVQPQPKSYDGSMVVGKACGGD